MKARILVLGASGFVGTHLCRALQASDWAVPIAASRGGGLRHGDDPAVPESLRLDATRSAPLAAAMRGVAGVVNCIAGSPRAIVDSARELFGAAQALANAPVIVHLSSMAVYGALAGKAIESMPLPAELSPYGAAKRCAEGFANAYPSAIVLRPGIVYGPGSAQWSTRVAEWLFARRLGDLGSQGDGCCNLVHVDDLVAAILHGLREPSARGRIFNLSLPSPPTWNDYFVDYARALRAVPVKRIGPRRLRIESRLLAPPLKVAEILAGRFARGLRPRVPKAISGSLVRLFTQEIQLDVTAAERDLGMRWTDLPRGIAQTAAWYRETTGRQLPPVSETKT